MLKLISVAQAIVRSIGSYVCRPAVYLGAIPLLLLIGAVNSLAPESEAKTGQRQVYAPPQKFRCVVLVLDSVGSDMAFDPSLMPFISSLRSSSLSGRSRSCPAKTTFPCVKSIFEGREATTGSTLQDFSGVASRTTSWPGSLAALGHRLVLISDHTLNRLYSDAFVDHLDYETLNAPLLERDRYAYEKTWSWLDDPTIDVLILHIIGTDKVAHEFPVRGPVYRKKYLEVDDFVKRVAGRLSSSDYLYVFSDHGHNQTGGHTEDAMYLARGPFFPKGRQENLHMEDMLFLLSVPYGLTLPITYEGQIQTDLTLLPEELRKRWLVDQAQIVGVDVAGLPANAAEKKLNDSISGRRDERRRNEGVDNLVRIAPWWLAAAFFLLGELPIRKTENRLNRSVGWAVAILAMLGILLWVTDTPPGAWLVSLAALLRTTARIGLARVFVGLALLTLVCIAVFWILPANLKWIHSHSHRPLGFALFYIAAAVTASLLSLCFDTQSWRHRAERMLWMMGVAVWLLSYFGPSGYSLTRHGPTVVIIALAPIALVALEGWRALVSLDAVCFLGLLPFLAFRAESLNINYELVNGFAQIPEVPQFVAILAFGIFFIAKVRSRSALQADLGRIRITGLRIIALVLWLVIAIWFFQFPGSRVLVCILGAIALLGCAKLFRRASLPARWLVLVGVIVLFMTLACLLNGFVLSHVDFRFAANKIIPFGAENLRAPQLIVWSMAKYLFALLPCLWVLGIYLPDANGAREMLQLGWWRQLTIALSAFGIYFFDLRGLHELCAEEIYFWIFLSLILWMFCLVAFPSPSGKLEPDRVRKL